MSTWFEPDDGITRRLEQTLRQEADAMSIPEKFDQVADAAYDARRRRVRTTIAGIAAGVTVLALAGGYLATQGIQRGTPGPAGTAAPVSTPIATPTPTGAPTATGAPTPSAAPTTPAPQAVTGTHLGFASPTGNLVCTMSVAGGVRCHAMTANWTGKDVPAAKTTGCTELGADFGPGQDVVLTAEGSFGSCVTEISVFEAVEATDGQRNTFGTEFRTWAGDDTELVEFMPGMTAHVLPYGTTATTGRYSCAMADTGITCSDSQSQAGFHLSRNDLTLR